MGVSLSINKDGYFRIRFRVSKRLIPFFKKTYISKSLQTKNRKDAKLKLNYIYYKYKQLLDASYILPNDLLQELVDEFVQNELKQKVSTSFTYNSKKYKVVSNSITMLDAYDKFSFWYNNQNVTTKQYALTTSKLKRIILPYFGETTHLIDITLESVEEFREFLSTFPNINKQRYKQLTFNQIINLKNVPNEDFITVNTQIKYLKILKQFFHYIIKANLLNYNPCVLLNMPNKNILNREPFKYDEILELFDIFETLDNKRYIYYSLAYTGMRPSEFWKCKISVDETGVIYFDLSDKNISLKTSSSHRRIPLHKELIRMDIHINLVSLQLEFTQVNISSYFNKTIKPLITTNPNKIMYSFRHTVATELKRAEISMDKVSEILGHTYENSSITKEVYAGKFTLPQLKIAIDSLNFSGVPL